jgi:hypothetical protein
VEEELRARGAAKRLHHDADRPTGVPLVFSAVSAAIYLSLCLPNECLTASAAAGLVRSGGGARSRDFVVCYRGLSGGNGCPLPVVCSRWQSYVVSVHMAGSRHEHDDSVGVLTMPVVACVWNIGNRRWQSGPCRTTETPSAASRTSAEGGCSFDCHGPPGPAKCAAR